MADNLRPDGTQKGSGYFGKMRRPDGKVSTELAFDFEADGKNVLAPLLVPTLSDTEIQSLLNGDKPTDRIYKKATDHAMSRLKEGKSPFAQTDDRPIDKSALSADNAMKVYDQQKASAIPKEKKALVKRLIQLQDELTNATFRRQMFGNKSLGVSDQEYRKIADEMQTLGKMLKEKLATEKEGTNGNVSQ